MNAVMRNGVYTLCRECATVKVFFVFEADLLGASETGVKSGTVARTSGNDVESVANYRPSTLATGKEVGIHESDLRLSFLMILISRWALSLHAPSEFGGV